MSATREHLARTLREDGVAAARTGDWEAAQGHFQRSYELDPRLLTLYNLAASELNVGMLVEADEHLRQFIRATEDGTHPQFRAEASRFREQIEGRIAGLTIELPNLLPSDEVTMDGTELPHAALGAELRVNPGRHVVVVSRDGQTVGEDTRVLGDAGHERMEMVLPVPTGPSVPTAREAAESTSGGPLVDPFAEPEPSHRGRNIAIVLISVAAVAGLVVGGYFLFADTGGDPYSGDFNVDLP